jgi:predicted DNA-binding transcriptional regulator AlpA
VARRTERAAANPAADFLTDPEAARLLNLGTTKLAELQKTDPTFPAPVRFGERAKRHVRAELLAWAMGRRGRINGGAR